MAFTKACATSSAWTWWSVSRPRLGSAISRPAARQAKTAGLKLAAGFLRDAVDGHSFDLSPRAMVDIRLPLPTAHTQDRVTGFNQAGREVRSDVSRTADDDDPHQSFQCAMGSPGTGA